MAHGSGAEICGGGWYRRDIQNCYRRQFPRLRNHSVFETSAGISPAGNGGIAFDRDIEEPELQVLEGSPLQKTIDVLVRICQLKSIFKLKYAALHSFGGGCKRWTIWDGGYLILLRVRARARSCGLGVGRSCFFGLLLIRFFLFRWIRFLAERGRGANASEHTEQEGTLRRSQAKHVNQALQQTSS